MLPEQFTTSLMRSKTSIPSNPADSSATLQEKRSKAIVLSHAMALTPKFDVQTTLKVWLLRAYKMPISKPLNCITFYILGSARTVELSTITHLFIWKCGSRRQNS